MFYIDTNILIYVNDSESPYHQSSADIFFNLLKQNKIILNEVVLTEFYAVITDSRKMRFSWTTAQARDYIKDLLNLIQELHFLILKLHRWLANTLENMTLNDTISMTI